MNLDIVSRIDDEIIEKNTVKRARLLAGKGRRNNKKLVLLLVAIITLIAIMIPLFIVLFSKQVPVYEGMTVSTTYQPSKNTASSGGVTMLSASGSGGSQISFLKDDNGNHNGHNKKPVEDIVDDEFSSSLTIPEQHMYYANPSQDIYITVHISNPDSFEILSFTLNGKKYSSYMFEDGSDMENLILKVTVPAGAEGITEYTIDAIKYVDGTAIKDVKMEGDRTVKVGVYTAGKQPTASVSDEIIGINDISFTVSINDRLDLIKMSEGNIFVIICDDSSVVYKQELNPDEINNIKFDSLIMDTTYRYAIVANYDSLDGAGFSTHILYEKEFTTKNIVAFKPASITQSGISFELEWEESFENKVLDSLALYKGEEKVRELDVNATSVDGLLSNNEYRLVATYTNKGETETSDLIFTTQAKAEPVFTFKNMASEIYSISGEYDITNIDDTLISYKLELYCGEELVKENTDKEIAFDSLDYYTDYTVKITYTFDVNDGKDVQTKTAEHAIKTLPYIDVTECKIANTSAVSEGETIFMQVKLDNPLDMTIESVVVNGETYSVTGASTTNKIFVEIVYSDQFAGGDTYLKVDKVNAKIDATTLAVAPKTELSDNVFINGKLEVLKLEFVNENLEPIDWVFPSDSVYLLITLDNPTGYTVDNIISHGGSETEEWIRIDDNQLYRSISIPSGWTTNYFESLVYHNQYVEKTLTCTGIETSCFEVTSDDTVYISSPDDLKNMNSGCYYELSDDIDLSGIEWFGKSLWGVFDGKGYSIKNMSFVGTIKNADAYLGLFHSGDGVIQNVNLKDATIIAEVSSDNEYDYTAYCGGLIAYPTNVIINNCTVDNNSIFTVNNKCPEGSVYIGGMAGYADSIITNNCINNGSVSATGIQFAYAGGMVGTVGGVTTITGCDNSGDVTTKGEIDSHAGGMVGKVGAATTILGCANSGSITGAEAGGMVASISGEILSISNSYNIGNLKALYHAGGMAGNVGPILITNCYNAGHAAGDVAAGMVGLSNYGDVSIISCYNVGSFSGPIQAGLLGLADTPVKVTITNSYTFIDGNDYASNSYDGDICIKEQLNSERFHINTLGWSEDVWDFSELDVENGKYPKLK